MAWKIKSEFLELILSKLPQHMLGYKDWQWYWQAGRKKYQSYIYAYRSSWRPYVVDGEKRYTCICMEAQSPDGTDWAMGVSSPRASELSDDHRERREELGEELRSLGKRKSFGWPCWELVGEYRNWNSLCPELAEELRKEDGGNITAYFVETFERFAREATPIIDRIEG